ncbi:MAG: hypothetical protein ACFFDI_21630 [Promethearchaeota archaeon]
MNSFKLSRFQGFILPIIIVTILAGFLSLSLPIAFGDEGPPSSTPIDASQTGGNELLAGLLNAIIWVTIAFVGSIIILLILKIGRQNILRTFFAIILGFSAFSFEFIFFWPLINIILEIIYLFLPIWVENWLIPFLTSPDPSFRIVDALSLVVSIGLGFVTVLVMGLDIGGRRGKNVFLILFGAMIGAYLGHTFPLWSTVLVLLGISFFDIYSVFRGPIRGMLEENRRYLESQGVIFPEDRPESEVENTTENNPTDSKEGQMNSTDFNSTSSFDSPTESNQQEEVRYARLQLLDQIVYSSGEIEIGLGDFAFYSFLIGHSILYPPFAAIFAILGVIIGATLTFKILDSGRAKALPGLPIPIFLGLSGMIIGGILGFVLFP